MPHYTSDFALRVAGECGTSRAFLRWVADNIRRGDLVPRDPLRVAGSLGILRRGLVENGCDNERLLDVLEDTIRHLRMREMEAKS